MVVDLEVPDAVTSFSQEARQAIYDVIALRRDVRHFQEGVAVPREVLLRILEAAHRAPSVGFSQPWGFIVVEDVDLRRRVRENFLQCRAREASRFPPGRREQYLSHRLEGILESALNVAIVVDLRERDEAILGTTVQPEAIRASAFCAVQNFWLAARAEGVGVGWVSILEPTVLRRELALPPGVEPLAYLCVGYPKAFRRKPMLEETGWLPRKVLADVVHWGSRWSEPQGAAHRPVPTLETAAVHASMVVAPSSVPSPLAEAAAASRAHQEQLLKPPGSLGRLEDVSAWYAAARGCFPSPPPDPVDFVLFAADHGVTCEGVSAYGSSVTASMVASVMGGGAACSVLARRRRVRARVVDVGVAGDLTLVPSNPKVPLLGAKVRYGTGNLRREPAMSLDEVRKAMAVGARLAREAVEAGVGLLIPGELGIGNTTAASALVSALLGVNPAETVGRGTGLDEEGWTHKCRVVSDALSRLDPKNDDPMERMAQVGGLELAAVAGYVLEGARHRVPTLLDGFIVGAAALFASFVDPQVKSYFLAAHGSAEPGHGVVLRHLGLSPLVQWDLRLGEGTGALLALDIVQSAWELEHSMATFATMGVVAERNPGGDGGGGANR